jgi:hypothetical protein
MIRPGIYSGLLILLLAAACRAENEDFNRDIRPILAENCFRCHGFDPAGRKGGLRLDDRDGATGKLKSGDVAIVPGKPDSSELVKRITATDDDDLMPPPATGKKLKPEQIQALRRWVAEGAVYAKHWSFQLPVKAPLPAVKLTDWPRNAIDYFVLARLEREGLSPSPEADKRALARRLALDITGLPPGPDELDAFLQDPSPDAYERLVDRLLASPAYGEHWGRRWLDLARYADTKGYEKDVRRTIWPYRDWVIDAFNADMPYDQFTREQIAGDLLPNPTTQQLIATGFHRNTLTNEEGGVDAEEYRVIAVKDRVDTTVQVWMGLTMGCAKCHTHKYDPISQRDYYQFYAFFNQTADANRGNDSPTIPVPTAGESERLATLNAEIAEITRQIQAATGLEAAQAQWEKQAQHAAEWIVARPSAMTSAGGSTLVLQPDGAVLAEGPGPATETYTVTFTPAVPRLTGVRLDVLPDPANPKGGVGRSRNDGNFVLTGVTLVARSPDGHQTPIPLSKAIADFAQKKYPIEHVLKNPDPRHHGWAVSPKLTEPHTAVFSTDGPVDVPPGTELTLTLDHQFEYSYPGFSIGKFRISVTDGEGPSLESIPPAVLNVLKRPAAGRTKSELNEVRAYFAANAPQNKPLRDELEKRKAELTVIGSAQTPVMRELPPDKRRQTRMMIRGNFLDPGDPVGPAVLSEFHPLPADAPKDRLGVAQWLCSADNPLTARVAVNRLWAGAFGAGIVETQEDFGTQGSPPSHQELLDWLAVDFRDGGWSLKRALKTIVLSATYRQSSRVTPELADRDGPNRLLARGARFRLDAEVIRDQALAVSGLLSRKMHGPSVMPYQPPGLWKSTYSQDRWVTSTGEDQFRRGIYTFIKRTTPYPSMVTFDGPSRETCTLRRSRTNTPLQALVTLNDPVFVQCAQALARRMAGSSDSSPQAQIALGVRSALLREPLPGETQVLVRLYQQRLQAACQDPGAAEKLATDPLGPLPPGDDPAKLAALTSVANVILNTDEFLTKG